MRHRDLAEDLQPPRTAPHIAITEKRVGSTGRNMVRVVAVFGQEPVGVSRQLAVVVAGIVPSCNVRSSIHRAHPPCDAYDSIFTI
jgi:hypothetical protein